MYMYTYIYIYTHMHSSIITIVIIITIPIIIVVITGSQAARRPAQEPGGQATSRNARSVAKIMIFVCI